MFFGHFYFVGYHRSTLREFAVIPVMSVKAIPKIINKNTNSRTGYWIRTILFMSTQYTS